MIQRGPLLPDEGWTLYIQEIKEKMSESLHPLILHYGLLTFSLAPCIKLLLFFTSLSAIPNQYSAFTKAMYNLYVNLRQKRNFYSSLTTDSIL